MKIQFLRHHHSFAIVFSMLLILLIGSKIIIPVLKLNWHLSKEVPLAVLENDLQKGEKKAEGEFKYKQEYIDDSYEFGARTPIIDSLVHSTIYAMDYISIYYYHITTPPPDFDLHTPC